MGTSLEPSLARSLACAEGAIGLDPANVSSQVWPNQVGVSPLSLLFYPPSKLAPAVLAATQLF